MKKVIESLQLDGLVRIVKKWITGQKNDDDDRFNHPFAIF